MTHPMGKLLGQDIAAGAVCLCSARLCVFHDHPTRQTWTTHARRPHDWRQKWILKIIWSKSNSFFSAKTNWIWFKRLFNTLKLKPRKQTHDSTNIWSLKDKWWMVGQTSAEGLVKLGVETPSTRPGWRYLKATQHPGLVWGERTDVKMGM